LRGLEGAHKKGQEELSPPKRGKIPSTAGGQIFRAPKKNNPKKGITPDPPNFSKIGGNPRLERIPRGDQPGISNGEKGLQRIRPTPQKGGS